MKTSRPDEARRAPSADLRLSLVPPRMALPWRRNLSVIQDTFSSEEILVAARRASEQPGSFLLGGGDLLQRGDLAELLIGLGRLRPQDLGICTLGHGIDTAQVQRLRSVGVQRLSVSFHSARQDAHDWLVGQPGTLKAAHRAIRTCLEAMLPVEVEIVLTRPTMLQLAETVEVLARIGVRRICVRRLTAMDVDPAGFVSLSPRLFLLEQALEQAATVALQRGVRLILRDLPVCVAPRLRPLFATPEREGWVLPDGTVRTRVESWQGCSTCPGLPRCAGAPRDYVSRFGWEEFATPGLPEARVHETVSDQQADRSPLSMSFTWRGPRRVTCSSCGDSPDKEIDTQGPHEATRGIRARLVQVARYRPSLLRLVGADLLAHPKSAPLIYDALRLFRRVDVAGEAGSVADWSDLDLRRLKDLQRLDFALYGPDAATHDAHSGIPGAFAAMERGVERLRSNTTIPVGGYAIVHDASLIPAFAAAWSQGLLPGEPRFRLSAQGASLDALLQCARSLPPGAARSALLALLPQCLCDEEGLGAASDADAATSSPRPEAQQSIHWGRSLPYQPCGSDPIGSFDACFEVRSSCTSSGCPGTAVGWHRTERSTQWTASL